MALLGPAAAVAFGLESVGWLVVLSGNISRGVAVAVDVVLLTIPAAFAVIAVEQRLERTHVAVAIAHACTPEQIRDALRSAVAEPGLELAFRLPDSPDSAGYRPCGDATLS